MTSSSEIYVVTLCISVSEAIEAIKTFPALDDAQAQLVLLMSGSPDSDLKAYAEKNNTAVFYLSSMDDPFSLRDALCERAGKLSLLVFWPRGGLFCRQAGISRAVALLKENKTDSICGLVSYDGNWLSEAGQLRIVNSEQTLLSLPIELEGLSWKPVGAHAFARVDCAGSLLVMKLGSLPQYISLTPENVPWGLRIALAMERPDDLSSLLFSGLQARTRLTVDDLYPGNSRDTQILFDNLERQGLIEVILFGRAKLVADDDNRQLVYQVLGKLDSEGKPVGNIDLSGFYRAVVNHAVIGPLYGGSVKQSECSKRSIKERDKLLDRLARAEASIQGLKQQSVLNADWKSLLARLMKISRRKISQIAKKLKDR